MSVKFRSVLFGVVLVVGCAAGGSGQRQAQSDDRPASVPVDPMLAACDAGTARSCLVAAGAREKEGDIAGAAALYRRACEMGEIGGCAFAGGAFAEAGKLDAAVNAFEIGCGESDPTSCYGLGLVRMGIFGGTADAASAARAFASGCSAGQADACGALADLYEAGEGVSEDMARATELRTQACEEGGSGACTRLGLAALKAGEEATASQRFAQACGAEVPDPDGCGWHGWATWSGLGDAVENQALGLATLKGSCEAESPVGCTFWGVVEERGGDAQRGAELLGLACELSPDQCDGLTAQYKAFVADEG